MKKIFIISLILVSCNKPLHKSTTYIKQVEIVDTLSPVYKTEQLLKKTEHIESHISNMIETNTKLHKELKTTKDSLKSVSKQLIETKQLVPKKKNLFQKLFNIKPDSVEIITQDTIIVE